MDYRDILKLKAFFSALKDVGFKALNLNQVPSFTTVDGQRIPVDKTYCLGLLRNLPQFQGDQFKDDNAILIYFSNSLNRKLILDRFSQAERIELEKFLEVRPVTEEGINNQPGGQEAQPTAETPTAGGEQASTMAGGINIPSITIGATAAPRIIIRNVPHAPETPKPEIQIANKSGVVREAGDSSKLVTADKGGVVKEAPPAKIYVADKSGAVVGEHPISAAPKVQTPPIPYGVKNAAKNLGSQAQIFTKRAGSRLASGFGNFLKGAGGAVGSLLGGLAGGGGRFFVRAGFEGVAGTGGFFSQISRPRSFKIGSGGKWAWAFGIALFAFFIFNLGSAISSPNQTTPTSEATPLPSDNLSSCQFTRGQENPKETTFKSNLLLSYIQEASQKSTIPAEVLAAFIRVESPSSSNMSDEEISTYSTRCVESSTGALGIMQIQPPGTTSARGDPASCDDCIDAGAGLVGKTVSTLTREDYCDPRTNIIVGAGWILKKMSKLGYGDGTTWDPSWTNNRAAIEALVNTYYGCLNYGGVNECTGPYNYADDVWTSIQSCKSQPLAEALGCPTVGTISNPYGYNIPDQPDNVTYVGCDNLLRCHSGIDISSGAGTSVHATFDGVANTVSSDEVKGRYITISNTQSSYAATFEHLGSEIVSQGESVKRGQAIGTMGSTGIAYGVHLHYRLEKDGKLVNPFRYLGPSATIASISLTQSDELSQNDYTGKPVSFNWGRCNNVP